MKFDELEPKYQRYIMRLSDKTEFIITGEEKNGITLSPSQFVELKNGEVINKSFIVSIKKDYERTRQDLAKLPSTVKNLLADK